MTDLPEFTYRLVIVVSILFSTAFAFPLAEPQQEGEWIKEYKTENRLIAQEILGKPPDKVRNRLLEDVQETPLQAIGNFSSVKQDDSKYKRPRETGVDSVQEILQVAISASDMYRLTTAVVTDSSAPDGKSSKMSEVENNPDAKAKNQGETDPEDIVSTLIKVLHKSEDGEYKAKPKNQETTNLFTPEIHKIEVPKEKPEVTIKAMIKEAFAGAESQLKMTRLLEEVMNKGLGQLLPNITGHLEKVGLDEHGSTVAVGVVEQEVWMNRDGARKPVKMRLQYALIFDNISEIVPLPLNHTDTETNETVLEEIDQMNASEEEEEESETNSVTGQPPMALGEYELMGATLLPSPPRPNPLLPGSALTPPYLTKPHLAYASPPYHVGLYNPYYYY